MEGDADAGDDDGVGYFFWRAKEKLASIARAFREGESIPVPVVVVLVVVVRA